MKNSKAISLYNISTHRQELMGIAVLFVVLFHGIVSSGSAWFGLKRMGNIGVDIFLFLSGIGMWFALTKNNSIKHFYWQRFKRVYPTWFLLASVYYIYNYCTCGSLSQNIATLIGNIVININFWQYGHLTFWYVPAIMMLYVFAPFYIKLLNNNRLYVWLCLLPIIFCIAIAYIQPLNARFWHLEIFFSRISIFMIGINIGQQVQQKQKLKPNTLPLLFVVGLSSFVVALWLEQYYHNRYPLFINRMLYIPLTLCFVTLAAHYLNYNKNIGYNLCKKVFAFLGSMSLEIYLIHLRFILEPLQRLHYNFFITFVLCLAITIPLAYMVKLIVNIIVKRI